MPVAVENAVVICEEEVLVTRCQRLGNCDVSCPRRSAVSFQNRVIDVAIRQGVLERAGVIHHVYARKWNRLSSHAVEKPKQALQVPPVADVARNDECACHKSAVYPCAVCAAW